MNRPMRHIWEEWEIMFHFRTDKHRLIKIKGEPWFLFLYRLHINKSKAAKKAKLLVRFLFSWQPWNYLFEQCFVLKVYKPHTVRWQIQILQSDQGVGNVKFPSLQRNVVVAYSIFNPVLIIVSLVVSYRKYFKIIR